MKDLANEIKIVDALVVAVRGAADVNGPAVDRAASGVIYEAVTFAVQVGAEGDALDGTTYFQLELEHSDDNSTWTNCAAGDVLIPKDQSVVLDGANSIVALIDAAAEAPVTIKFGYKGGKRYARLVLNKEGTHTNGTPIGAVAILSHPSVKPVA